MEFLKLVYCVKRLIHLLLLIGFLFMTGSALLNLISRETTHRISRESKPLDLPSFTLCAYTSASPKKDLINLQMLFDGVMGNGSTFPIPFKVRLFDETEKQHSLEVVELTNMTAVKNHWQLDLKELWAWNCKFVQGEKNTCVPCLTFTPPKLKDKRVFMSVIFFLAILILILYRLNFR